MITLRTHAETLSDGSEVFNVHVTQNTGTPIVLHAVNRHAADELIALLHDAIATRTVDEVMTPLTLVERLRFYANSQRLRPDDDLLGQAADRLAELEALVVQQKPLRAPYRPL